MTQIKVLPDNLINKIAAGEVLERPSSAVKELVENSIDAGAKKIQIYIRNGGKTEITVVDDGCGIQSNQIELAIKRHATSKLGKGNLSNINTLGFRGEALPSIASVSDMTIKSNVNSDQNGTMLNIVSGNVKKIGPTNQSKGTFVSVKNLFFSTPARLKFLKKENYESLLIKRIIQKLAISNHSIQFNLSINDKNVIRTNNKENSSNLESLKNRVSDILGTDFVENSVILNHKFENFKFRGLLGLPTFHHSNSNNQYVFVNGRVVSDKSINVIFKLAYRDFISFDRYPQLILFIESPSNEVDINVHPAKNEVRFKDINLLRSKIIHIFKETLADAGHRSSSLNTVKAINKFTKNSPYQNNLKLKTELPKEINRENQEDRKDNYFKKKSFEKEPAPLGYAKSQFHKTYVISETNNGIVIVDQHAAHERIVYEKLKKDFYEKKIKTQILLIPVVIDLDKTTLDNLRDCYEIAEKYGMKIEQFGNESVIVREIPSILSNCDINKLTLDIIDELIDSNDTKPLEKKIDDICSRMSCHGSLRAGRELQVDEMNDLLRKMEKTPYSGQCNHGRPTYIELKLNDIEKLFGRK
ncbi:MAG: DNA mismatch repair protein MutL [Rickettsiales bacterium]|nr:DNA mismatch repair protein MutL [Rickettsiales bacterium]